MRGRKRKGDEKDRFVTRKERRNRTTRVISSFIVVVLVVRQSSRVFSRHQQVKSESIPTC